MLIVLTVEQWFGEYVLENGVEVKNSLKFKSFIQYGCILVCVCECVENQWKFALHLAYFHLM